MLPAVWWEPLHLDEALTLSFARQPPWRIVGDIFIDRGGAPAHFFVESATLAWPGGVAGLRIPSVVFFAIAILMAGPIALELADESTAIALPFLLAFAPLTVGLATFARMYTLFLACVLGATILSMRAGRTRESRHAIIAGAAAGALVYVHPVAPLYIPLVLATGLAASRDPPRLLRRPAMHAALSATLIALPYAYALAVLSRRYHVGEARVETAGRSVAVESIHALSPADTAGSIVFGCLAVVGIVAIARLSSRKALVLALWTVVPIMFFLLVPARTRFFDRYLLPTLPFFLLCVILGCAAIGRRLKLDPAWAATLGIGALVALELDEDASRLRSLHRARLPELVRAYGRVAQGSVLFSSTGSPRSDRPPELLDDYVSLEAPGGARVEELPALDPRYQKDVHAKGVASVKAFLARQTVPEVGVWIFRGKPRRVVASMRRLEGRYRLLRLAPDLLIVMTRAPEPARVLVEDGTRVRDAWGVTTPADRWVQAIRQIDQNALAATATAKALAAAVVRSSSRTTGLKAVHLRVAHEVDALAVRDDR